MIKKNINVLAAVALIATGAIVAGACSDSDYDFDEIDSTVGIGGELTIPASTTDTIRLEDVLDLDNSDCVTVKDNGDYVFEQQGGEIDVTEIRVEGFTIMENMPDDASARNRIAMRHCKRHIVFGIVEVYGICETCRSVWMNANDRQIVISTVSVNACVHST